MVNTCNVCKVFNTKPYGATATADMPQLTAWKPADFFGDYRGRFCRTYRFQDYKEGATKMLQFAVYVRHVEGGTLRKTQTAEEF